MRTPLPRSIALLALLAVFPGPASGQQAAKPSDPMAGMPQMQRADPPQDPLAGLQPLTPPTELLTEAATRTPLGLQDFLARAATANPILARSRAEAQRTHGRAAQAGLFPNPSVGYQGDQIRGGAYGGGEQGGFVAQTIPLGGKLRLRQKALEAEAQADAGSTDVVAARLRGDVTAAFYAALAAQETAHIRRDLLKLMQDAVETAKQLRNVGQADAPDVLSTEIEEEQAQIADAQAQRVFLAHFQALATMAGDTELKPAPLAGDLAAMPTLQAHEILPQISARSPELQRARLALAASEARLSSARRDVIPDLELKAGEQNNLEQLGTPAAASRAVGPQSFASAAITLPLWNRNQGNIQAAQAEVESARLAMRQAELDLAARAQPLLQNYLAATQEAERYRTSILPRAKRVVHLYEQKYTQMAQAYPQVLIARRTLLDLQMQYIRSLERAQRSAGFLANGALSSSSPSFQPTD